MTFAQGLLSDQPRALQQTLLMYLLSQEQLRTLWQELFTELAPYGLLTGHQIESNLAVSDLEVLRAGNLAQKASLAVVSLYWTQLKQRLHLHEQPDLKGPLLLKIYLGAAIAGNVALMQYVARKGAFVSMGPWRTLPPMLELTMANAQLPNLDLLFSLYPKLKIDWHMVNLIPRSRPDFLERVLILFVRGPITRKPILEEFILRELNSFPVNGPFLRTCLQFSINPDRTLLARYLRPALLNASLVGVQTLLDFIINPEARKDVIRQAMLGLQTQELALRLVMLVNSYL